MRLKFDRAGIEGVVEVSVRVNEEPATLGCPEVARGFPCCRATISPPARGYADFLGWVQLVRSTDTSGEFRIDPFEPLGYESHPFCFYGFAPVLFDAPHRDHREEIVWMAHSFLCGLGGDPLDREHQVDALLGFGWGFEIRGENIHVHGPQHLGPEDWNSHLPHLDDAFPSWSFLPGFSGGGPEQ